MLQTAMEETTMTPFQEHSSRELPKVSQSWSRFIELICVVLLHQYFAAPLDVSLSMADTRPKVLFASSQGVTMHVDGRRKNHKGDKTMLLLAQLA